MSPLRWTTKSLRHLAAELSRQGHRVTAPTVGRLLKDNGFSLQSTAKTLEDEQHPDRNAQFRYINEQAKAHQAASEPVISVDAKKKEQFGCCYRWPGGSGARAGTRSRWRTTASSPARACRRCHSAQGPLPCAGRSRVGKADPHAQSSPLAWAHVLVRRDPYKVHYVCVVPPHSKHPWDGADHLCPSCRAPMLFAGHDFAAPRRRDDSAGQRWPRCSPRDCATKALRPANAHAGLR